MNDRRYRNIKVMLCVCVSAILQKRNSIQVIRWGVVIIISSLEWKFHCRKCFPIRIVHCGGIRSINPSKRSVRFHNHNMIGALYIAYFSLEMHKDDLSRITIAVCSLITRWMHGDNHYFSFCFCFDNDEIALHSHTHSRGMESDGWLHKHVGTKAIDYSFRGKNPTNHHFINGQNQ